MDNINFSVLVSVKLSFYDSELVAFARSTSNEEKLGILGQTREVFFVFPDSNKKIAFLNSELLFSYKKSQSQINSLLLSDEIGYLDNELIAKIFANIEFQDFKRDEFHYLVGDITRAYIQCNSVSRDNSRYEI